MRCVTTSPPYRCDLRISNRKNWSGILNVQASDAAGNVGSASIQLSNTQ